MSPGRDGGESRDGRAGGAAAGNRELGPGADGVEDEIQGAPFSVECARGGEDLLVGDLGRGLLVRRDGTTPDAFSRGAWLASATRTTSCEFWLGAVPPVVLRAMALRLPLTRPMRVCVVPLE